MDTYKEPVIIKTAKCTVKILRPELSEEEREKRMKEIERAAAELLMAAEKERHTKGNINR